MKFAELVVIGALTLSCSGCFGLRAGSRYPDYDSDAVDAAVLTPENDESPWMTLGEFKISETACEGIDTHPMTKTLAHDDLSRFLDSTGATGVEIMARGDLFWFEFPGTDPSDGDRVRLRLAVLNDSKEAADELHKSLLEHGPGWWGFRRANLSILAPKAGVSEAIGFALKYKLMCWGMVEMAGADDVYVVPGPYMEI